MKRLAVVVAISLMGFAAAFVSFGDAARRGCFADAPVDAAYNASFAQPISTQEEAHLLDITRDGEPVSGAAVCLTVDMVGMSAMGAGKQATEVSPGRYAVEVTFPMGGAWQGRVLVSQQGKDQIAVPLAFDVAANSS